MLAVKDLCFVKLRVAFVCSSTFVALRQAIKRLSSCHYKSTMPTSVSSAVLPISRRSFQFGSGICKDFQVSSLIAVLISPPKTCGHFLLLACEDGPRSWQFSLAMFCKKLKKGLATLRSAFQNVPRLNNRDPALQAIFAACIIIGWIMLTNVPRVHNFIYSQPARPQVEFGTGI